jgi:hypothetical protein
MENTFNVSVILPIKTATPKDFNEFLKKAIDSVAGQQTKVNELVIVHTDEELLTKTLNDYDFGDLNVKKLVWSDEPNFSKQVNFGISEASSEWVSVLEFDDEYSAIWFKNVKNTLKFIKTFQYSYQLLSMSMKKEHLQGLPMKRLLLKIFHRRLGSLVTKLYKISKTSKPLEWLSRKV